MDLWHRIRCKLHCSRIRTGGFELGAAPGPIGSNRVQLLEADAIDIMTRMTLSSNSKRDRVFRVRSLVAGLMWWVLIFPRECPAGEADGVTSTNAFPSVAEVIGSQTFENHTEEDIYFLRAIHDRYSSRWPDLLNANITLADYVVSPEKLERFVNELGDAMRDRNDPVACTNLAMVTGDPAFYADNVYNSGLVQAAARALIKIGPEGRKVLAAAFTENHYRANPQSLEDLAEVIGQTQPAGPEFISPLVAMAFDFTITNGGFYPHCTTTAVKNLLHLAGGPAAVQSHLKIEEIFNNPDRYQSVMDGIAATGASELATNLAAIQVQVQTRITALAKSPGGYRDDLQDLVTHIGQALTSLAKGNKGSG